MEPKSNNTTISDEFNFDCIPLIDIAPFMHHDAPNNITKQQSVKDIRAACTTSGFFYIKGHGVTADLRQAIIEQAKEFFALPLEEKMKIHMKMGGTAWRGYFPAGEEYTSGIKDLKQGLYLGQQLPPEHPQILNGTPLHGQNLFPKNPADLKQIILTWISRMQSIGAAILRGIACSLGLAENYFIQQICKEPLGLFRIFHYPPETEQEHKQQWGVGEHTDYGIVTILMVTDKGLEVKNRKNEWVKADPLPDTFIVNIGDMLQRLTKGLYRSTPHRVRNTAGKSRYAFPFFYDPGWNAEVREIDVQTTGNQKLLIEQTQLLQRWDKQNLRSVNMKYGQYLMRKISKVFPELAKEKLADKIDLAAVTNN